MANVDVYNWDKKKVGDATLNAEVFEAPVREDILHTVVKWQLACRRQGTHKAKTRGEVSGGGSKPYKQKGTGNARRGSSRSPLIAGGGATFAPRMRYYGYTLPRKVKQAGLKSALSHLFKEGRLFVVDAMDVEGGKTKNLVGSLNKFGAQKAVLISAEEKESTKRASSNLQNFRYYSVEGLNVYDLLKFDTAIITQDSLDKINQRCGVEA